MGKNLVKSQQTFLFCDGGSCQKAGSENVVRAARSYLRNNGLWENTHTIKTRCNGRCEDAPTCIVHSGDFWYKELTPDKIKEVVISHLDHQKPVEAYLLYQEKDFKMNSKKEIAAVKPKPFDVKKDDLLGTCFITKGFSSDQYLYPLFLYLSEQNIQGEIIFASDLTYSISELESVVYESLFTLELNFKNKKQEFLTIGGVPKEESLEVAQSKISSTEYFISIDNNQKGIRFKNKIGKLIAMLYINPSDSLFWEYCLKIQLLGMQDPIVEA
ncbi:(2Fe-2S) ferredoxin domain-containing protein [Flavobacterium sp. 7A]|uniref:(2Fe-2S) ferredoxin domain-containing protein n=1 Tax=Flavobacterium sp. 7A TaxID=2940571 RepID=UPI0022270EC8|nr:(2Fe-2S) ferredoxin domain-containing protein [Flavobacterium sp. 7A]MCW2119672.1 (2Fe-2S) ferredoxin [Flavobacterium sp. 7A]